MSTNLLSHIITWLIFGAIAYIPWRCLVKKQDPDSKIWLPMGTIAFLLLFSIFGLFSVAITFDAYDSTKSSG